MAGRRVGDRQEFELSRITTKKALDVLKAEDLIETAPGRGLFVEDHRANYVASVVRFRGRGLMVSRTLRSCSTCGAVFSPKDEKGHRNRASKTTIPLPKTTLRRKSSRCLSASGGQTNDTDQLIVAPPEAAGDTASVA